MDVVNGARCSVLATEACDPAGQPRLLVIAKRTYELPSESGGPLRARDNAQDILVADIFDGEPGTSSPVVESDLAFCKAQCDVIVRGHAHAPNAQALTELPVMLHVGQIRKELRVVGDRLWERSLLGVRAGAPRAFSSMPISWTRAFGGTTAPKDPDSERDMCETNPVGCGYARRAKRDLVGTLAPNFEVTNESILRPGRNHTPAGFGPLGRSWMPRRVAAGTYGDAWKDEVFPALPADFDQAFFQCAPIDQRMPYPEGGEKITLLNLMPGGGVHRFALPKRLNLPLAVITRDRETLKLNPVVDTLVIDTDQGTLDVVWRASLPLKRSVLEIATLGIGQVCRRWWTSRVNGTDDCGCGGNETADEDMAAVTDLADETA